jgi:hypothetical protein
MQVMIFKTAEETLFYIRKRLRKESYDQGLEQGLEQGVKMGRDEHSREVYERAKAMNLFEEQARELTFGYRIGVFAVC